MIRTYNGNINRNVLRDLKRICIVNEENMKNFLEEYAKKGEVFFYTNLNPFFGCADEMSEENILKSEEEIKDFLNKDAQEKIECYLNNKRPDEDYLLNSVIEYIRENNKFPSNDEMKQLEQTAETKRVAELSSENITEKIITEKDIIKEILELSEEIIESRRETKPDDIKKYCEPHDDELHISNDNFYGLIKWQRHYGNGDSTDYRFIAEFKNDRDVHTISFHYYHNKDVTAIAEDWYNESVKITEIIDRLITLHKGIVEIAKEEGIEFISEIDYKKIVVNNDNKEQTKILSPSKKD